MAAVVSRTVMRLSLALICGLSYPALAAPESSNKTINVTIDQASLVKLPDHVATIVVGNPLIADVSLQSGGTMVVTGKGYGSTNMIAMDRAGTILVDRIIEVQGPNDKLITMYRGIERETYSCTPFCQRRVTLGDGPVFFDATLNQGGALNAKADAATGQRR